MKRTEFEARHDKHRALNAAEDKGEVADSMAVRHALLERVRSGEISLAESQAELRKIKRNARKNGLTTRGEVWRNG